MSKVNTIRKKALEHVRSQNWESAIKEYKRLAELDQTNPNVFNELGDIYLKTGNKSDAYDAFIKAIDAYARVSLHNNAVAVCKKVLRLIPTRIEILTKLGLIRKKQGLNKEAESYYLSYLDKLITDQNVSPDDLNKLSKEIVSDMNDSFTVLEKLNDCMVKFGLKNDTGDLLEQLFKLYQSHGMDGEKEQTRSRLQELGITPPASARPVQKEGTVITEDNIWSAEAHTDGERIGVDYSPGSVSEIPAETMTAAPGPSPDQSKGKANTGYDFGNVELNAGQAEYSPDVSTQTMTEPEPQPEPQAETEPEPEPEPQTETEPEEVKTTAQPWESMPTTTGEGGKPDAVKVSAIIDDLATDTDGEVGEEDYRSHYDLGMAYLEMDLLPEAIREYQFAAKCPQYQARSLEMIGHCFLKQNQPGLAIKQLTKGLAQVGADNRDSLGIKYNLGLAYEMAGDLERAKSAFEDVYVEDVTFRDVSEKMAKFK